MITLRTWFVAMVLCLTGKEFLFADSKTDRALFESLQHADQALMRHDYRQAWQAYHKVLAEGIHTLLDNKRLSDLSIDLARCEWEVGNREEARQLLTHLLKTELSHRQQVEAQLLLARICHGLGQHEEAFALLHLTEERVPKESWARGDRILHSRLSLLLDDTCEQLILKAQRAFESGDYQTALESYQQVLGSTEQGTYPTAVRMRCTSDLCKNLRFRIGECHYLNGDHALAISWLSQCGDAGARGPFLAGLAHKRAGQPLEAIAQFAEFLAAEERSENEVEETEWHLGCSCLAAGRLDEARAYFGRRLRSTNQPKLACMAQLYLARIDHKQGDLESAKERLDHLKQQIPREDSLFWEIAGLCGDIAYQEGQFITAINYLEPAIAASTPKLSWHANALYTLGQSYVGLSKLQESETASLLLSKAISTCSRHLELTGTARARLGLAQARLVQFQRFSLAEARRELIALTALDLYEQTNDRLEALLIRAAGTTDELDCLTLLKIATLEEYDRVPRFAHAWLQRGLSELNLEQPEDAASSFARAYALFQRDNGRLEWRALAEQSRALYNCGRLDTRQEAVTLLERVVTDPIALQTAANPDELLYLYGLSSAALGAARCSPEMLQTARMALLRTVNEFGQGKWAPPALKLMGTAAFQSGDYEQASKDFSRLATAYPDSSEAPEALFWAAESLDWAKGPSAQARALRVQLYQNHSTHRLASEAYFRCFALADYMNGNEEALQHLEGMAARFPHSAFLTVAHYITGSRCADAPAHARRCFNAAIKCFDASIQTNEINPDSLEYLSTVRYQAALERGLSYLAEGQATDGARREVSLESAAEALNSILLDLKSGNSPAAVLLAREPGYPRIAEQAAYALAQTHLLAQNNGAAETILSAMVQRYHKFGITEGYYPACVWYQLGQLALNSEDWEVALKYLRRSENAATPGVWGTDQRLELLLAKSKAFEGTGRIEDAIRMLSDAVNDPAASPKRLEAMFRRAELYERTGSPEHALKQWEALARKSGTWANQAQLILDTHYAVN